MVKVKKGGGGGGGGDDVAAWEGESGHVVRW
jgi:hypothetical protein